MNKNNQECPVIPDSPKPIWGKPTEQLFINEKINPRYFLMERVRVIDFSTQWLNYYGRRWPEEAEYLKNLNVTATQYGVDLKVLTGESITLKDIKSVDDFFEMLDDKLDALESHLKDLSAKGNNLLPEAVKEAWVRTLTRLRSLRTYCRNATDKNLSPREALVYESTATLRSMLYLMRSDLNTKISPHGFIMVPPHLVLLDMVSEIAYTYRDVFDIDGVIGVIPPRHGKTWWMIGDEVRLLSLEPSKQCGWLHSKEDYAEDRVNGIKKFFDVTTAEGRRRRTLWPAVEMDTSRSKRTGVLQLKSSTFTLEETLVAYGVSTGGQGVTFHRMRADDVIDQKEALEASTRERTNKFMTQTWQNRLTGTAPFEFHVGTRWHKKDILGTMLDLDRKRLNNYAYVSLACGGADEDFRALWPEAGRDSNWLRRKFYALGAVDYELIYRNNTDSKESRKLRSIKFWPLEVMNDTEAPRNWKKFFAGATHTLITDPAGKENQRNNKIGLLYVAHGMFETELPSGLLVDTYMALAIRLWDHQASQATAAELIAKFVEKNPVDEILIESTGMDSVGEQLEKYYGIDPFIIINKAPPRGGNKIQRFTQVSTIVENGWFRLAAETGDLGRLEPTVNMLPLIEQMQHPHTIKDLNLLDCITLFLLDNRDKFMEFSVDHPELVERRKQKKVEQENRWYQFWKAKEKAASSREATMDFVDVRRRMFT